MLTCSGCRVARFCSADHQKTASKKTALGGSLTTGRHKNICGGRGKWREVAKDGVAPDSSLRTWWRSCSRLSRVLFNNKSCRLRGVANAARTRIRMASEQDEEEGQVSGEWRRKCPASPLSSRSLSPPPHFSVALFSFRSSLIPLSLRFALLSLTHTLSLSLTHSLTLSLSLSLSLVLSLSLSRSLSFVPSLSFSLSLWRRSESRERGRHHQCPRWG
jgi:hypothetical protein